MFKQRWASLLFSDAAVRPDPTDQQPQSRAQLCGRFDPALCQGYLEAAETGQPDAKLSALLDESGLERIVPAIRAPTLIIQGEDDTLFPLDQADANFRALPATTPATMRWVAGGHDGEISVDPLIDDLEEWFGRYLKRDGSAPDASFSALMPETSLLGQDRGTRDPQTLIAQTYPGRGSRARDSAGGTHRRSARALRPRRVVRRRRSPTFRVPAAPSGKHPVWPAMRSAFFLINRRASRSRAADVAIDLDRK